MDREPLTDIERNFKGEHADLIPVLQKIQSIHGYISQDAISRISRWLKISENEVYGVASFYAQFRFTPPGKRHITVCLGTACHVKGGEQMIHVLKRRLGIDPGETTADGEYDLKRVACLGCCALAPVINFDDKVYAQMSVLKLQGILDENKKD